MGEADGPFQAAKQGLQTMSATRNIWLSLLASLAIVVAANMPASAQQQKPNILFIMGDDIGWMQPSITTEA